MELNSILTLSELVDALEENNNKQSTIYKVYQRAAELDLEFKALKDEEKKIRMYISLKVKF